MSVHVRMYRQGLGDCFLLTFDGGATPFHVLIDCGVLLGTSKPKNNLIDAVKDIAATTNKKLDVLVATHEHWDHVSGFVQARELFDDLEIGQIWMAWTEEKGDELADKLREDREERKAKIALAVDRWNVAVGAAGALSDPEDDPSAAPARIATTQSLLGFFGGGLAAAGGGTTADAMDYLRRPGRDQRYLRPGERFPLAGTGAHVYVLGPPRDERYIKKSRPTKTGRETYSEDSQGLTVTGALFAAIDRLAGAQAIGPYAPESVTDPFDAFYRIAVEDPTRNDFFLRRYQNAESWRRIDHDWLGATSDLALALDNDTNNTSLVLAFELGDGGDVLLFAADAQVGNWLSWQDLRFPAPDGRRRKITSDDLLARTVLYKVGHHASHNATLREHGLEKMVSDGLVAMIPVDHGMAEKKKWNMPFPPLLDRLAERSRGRVLRIDDGAPAAASLRRLSPEDRASFTRRVKITPLYIEYTVED